MKKQRLDVLLVEKGCFPSRERAKTAIMEGLVYVGGAISDKPGTPVDVDAEIEVRSDPCPFVSRGGLKLEKTIGEFGIDLTGKTCMDVGASTGGFTDCMLSHGASRVYSIDVGYGQLAYKLRTDSRVVSIEKCNFRYIADDAVPHEIDFASADVSFISLSRIFPAMVKFMRDGSSAVVLVKPQFEAGREDVGKNGIVRDPAVHERVIADVISYAAENGLCAAGLTYSPVKGAKGNIEYLLLLNKGKNIVYNIDGSCIHDTVTCSHEELV